MRSLLADARLETVAGPFAAMTTASGMTRSTGLTEWQERTLIGYTPTLLPGNGNLGRIGPGATGTTRLVIQGRGAGNTAGVIANTANAVEYAAVPDALLLGVSLRLGRISTVSLTAERTFTETTWTTPFTDSDLRQQAAGMLVAYGRVLSTDEMRRVLRWLARRHGILGGGLNTRPSRARRRDFARAA